MPSLMWKRKQISRTKNNLGITQRIRITGFLLLLPVSFWTERYQHEFIGKVSHPEAMTCWHNFMLLEGERQNTFPFPFEVWRKKYSHWIHEWKGDWGLSSFWWIGWICWQIIIIHFLENSKIVWESPDFQFFRREAPSICQNMSRFPRYLHYIELKWLTM